MPENKNSIQLVWGVLLLAAGLGIFIMTPQKMREIEKIAHFSSYIPFIWFCFYFIGVLLVGGGIRKIYHNYRRFENGNRTKHH